VNAPSGFPVAGDLILGDEIAEEVVSSQLEAGDWWFGSVDEWLTVATVLSSCQHISAQLRYLTSDKSIMLQ
jgi:hypothetical protein